MKLARNSEAKKERFKNPPAFLPRPSVREFSLGSSRARM